MEMGEIKMQRLTGQGPCISLCILVSWVAIKMEKERRLWKTEMPYLWQTKLLIIEFNLCFILYVTFEEFVSVLSLMLAGVKPGLNPLFSYCSYNKKNKKG